MIKFSNFLTEDKSGKNLHMEHIEDEILNYGINGGRSSINFLQSLRDMLSGSSRSSINMTVKWDGTPAIFAGIDPSDSKFFVAKKSVFNPNPILFKSEEEIKNGLKDQDLIDKFIVALKEFKKLGIKNVLQGDLMFVPNTSASIETKTIDGEKNYTFQPNTIVYAVPVDSDLGKKIKSAKIGIVWHTTYTGTSLPDMKASFGVDISNLSKPSSVWMDDATYKDVSGKATMTAKETASVTKSLSNAGSAFQKINSPMLSKFLNLQNTFTGNLSGASLKTYNNSKVRQGKPVSNPKSHAQGYVSWVEDTFQKQIDKLKTQSRKDALENKKKEIARELQKHTSNLTNVIAFQNHVVEAKMGIVRKLNTVKGLTNTFIKTANGFKVTNPEGYVAIDRISGNAVKLVDRMEFSFNNFTAIKAWDK